jgi:hypothetical protein
MMSSGTLRHVALVRTDDSEELSASFIRVIRIGEVRTLPSCNYQPTHAAKGGAKFLRNVGSYKRHAA